MAEDERADPRLREQVAAAVDQLDNALAAARKYDNDAAAIDKAMKTADLPRLLELRRKVAALETVEMVRSQAPPPGELQVALDSAIDQQVRRVAAEFSRLDDLNAYQWHQRQLQDHRKVLGEVGLTTAVTALDTALAQLDEREKALRAIMKEQPTRDMIGLIRVNLPLAALYDQRDTLLGLEGFGDSTMALRNGKLQQTTAEIDKLEREAQTLPAAILSSSDQRSLRSTLERVIRISDRYEGTPFAAQVQAAQDLIDKYGHFMTRLMEMRGSIQNLRGPEDAAKVMTALDELEAGSKEWLGDLQRTMLKNVRRQLDAQVASKRGAADNWFREVEGRARSNGNLIELLPVLENLPPYLSPKHQTRVDELREEARRRLERDAVARIEREFLQIRDQGLRQNCIARLQQLMHQHSAQPENNPARQ